MASYLTSRESLEKLCKTEPDHPISYGIGKIAGGIGLSGVGAATGGFGWWFYKEVIASEYSDAFIKGGGIGLEIILGGIAVASGGYGLYLLADGFTSLLNPFCDKSRDGSFYHRNGGFINKPSVFDKKFGKKVIPIEHVNQLNQINEENILVNNIITRNAKITSKEKIRHVGKTTHHYTEYTAVLHGEFYEQPITIFTVTEDEGFAKSVANLKKESAIYVMGNVDKDKRIELERFGNAFER